MRRLLIAGIALCCCAGSAAEPLPIRGKAPVFAVITKVEEAAGTFNYILLYDEVINTERVVTDAAGKTLNKTSDSVMTSRFYERTGRSLKGSIVSTGDGRIIPMKQVLKELPGKLVLFCDDFDGLHPDYRRLLAKDAWIIEPEKQGGVRQSDESPAN